MVKHRLDHELLLEIEEKRSHTGLSHKNCVPTGFYSRAKYKKDLRSWIIAVQVFLIHSFLVVTTNILFFT